MTSVASPSLSPYYHSSFFLFSSSFFFSSHARTHTQAHSIYMIQYRHHHSVHRIPKAQEPDFDPIVHSRVIPEQKKRKNDRSCFMKIFVLWHILSIQRRMSLIIRCIDTPSTSQYDKEIIKEQLKIGGLFFFKEINNQRMKTLWWMLSKQQCVK